MGELFNNYLLKIKCIQKQIKNQFKPHFINNFTFNLNVYIFKNQYRANYYYYYFLFFYFGCFSCP